MDKLRAYLSEIVKGISLRNPSHFYPRTIRSKGRAVGTAWVPKTPRSGRMARRHGRLRKGQLDSVKRIELLIHCLGWTRSEYFSDYHVCL